MIYPDPTQPVPVSVRERYKWPLRLVLALAIGVLAWQTVASFILPACDSSRVSTALRDIFVGLDLEVLSLGEFRDLPDLPAGRMCEARIESPEETARIEFVVAWDGWTPFVRIENVENLPP